MFDPSNRFEKTSNLYLKIKVLQKNVRPDRKGGKVICHLHFGTTSTALQGFPGFHLANK